MGRVEFAVLLLLVGACATTQPPGYVPGGAGLPDQARKDYRRALNLEYAGEKQDALVLISDLCSRHPTRLGFHVRRLRIARDLRGAAYAASLYQPPPPGVDATRAEILSRLAWAQDADLADINDVLQFAEQIEPREAYWPLALADVEISHHDAAADQAAREKRRGRLGRSRKTEAAAQTHLDGALELAERALALDPRFAEAHVMVGYVYTRKAETTKDIDKIDEWREKAGLRYDEALKLDPEMLTALLDRAENRLHFNDFRGAVEDLLRAAEVAPRETLVWNNLGSVYFGLGSLADARKAYETALEIEPKDAVARTALADCHRAVGDLEKAIAELLQAGQDGVDDHAVQATIAFKLASIYEYQHRYRDAVQQYERHISHVARGGLPASSAAKARSRIRHIINHAFSIE